MNLDEAISHCREKAQGDCECAKEHRKLLEWLLELQLLRSKQWKQEERT